MLRCFCCCYVLLMHVSVLSSEIFYLLRCCSPVNYVCQKPPVRIHTSTESAISFIPIAAAQNHVQQQPRQQIKEKKKQFGPPAIVCSVPYTPLLFLLLSCSQSKNVPLSCFSTKQQQHTTARQSLDTPAVAAILSGNLHHTHFIIRISSSLFVSFLHNEQTER